jgi:hypothetical protein
MIGLALCLIAFVVAYRETSKSVGHAFRCILAVGYVYGIVRARLDDGFGHFIFDSAVVGCYWSHFASRALTRLEMRRTREVSQWTLALIGWPMLLVLIPYNNIVVQFIGLRAAIFFLPFVLIGARAEEEDLDLLAEAIAWLNIVAVAVGVAEYFVGIEPFFPRNRITTIMYMSADVAGGKHRIPSIFSSAHAFGGMMVTTFAFLANQLVNPRVRPGTQWLIRIAATASAIGAFMSGARQPVVLLFIILAVLALNPAFDARFRFVLGFIGAIVAAIVMTSERFQRFMTLSDTDAVVERIEGSMHMGFFEMILEHPFGAGLGSAAGTSVPHFLEGWGVQQIGMENEYGRIALEQSPIGLLLWCGFIFWCLTRSGPLVSKHWALGTRLARISCAAAWTTAFIGTGMLTAIPGTPFLLFELGMLSRSRLPRAPQLPFAPAPPPAPRARVVES